LIYFIINFYNAKLLPKTSNNFTPTVTFYYHTATFFHYHPIFTLSVMLNEENTNFAVDKSIHTKGIIYVGTGCLG